MKVSIHCPLSIAYIEPVGPVVRADALVDNIRFITLLILNADESDSL